MPSSHLTGSILVADDNTDIRRMLAIQLTFLGHTVTEAADGQQSLDLIGSQPFDLVLLDLTMPKVSGFGVLEVVKGDPSLRHLPFIVISAAGELKNAVRSIELGAEDFLSRPFETSILRARIGASLERKRLRDNEQAYLRTIEQERATSERLLLNVLPKPIADRLREERRLIVDQLPTVTVLFADIADFTLLASRVSPEELIEWLNDVFSAFDDLANTYGLEKIKTIDDAYMAAAGLPTARPDNAEAAATMALGMLDRVSGMTTPNGEPFHIRIGLDSGPVVAGVVVCWLDYRKVTMRKVQIIAFMVTLALAIPFITLALIEIAYLIDYARSIGGALTGVMDWHSVALEGSARWPELAGMIIGQLLILSILLIARRHKPDSDPDLFENDLIRSSSERTPGDQTDPPKRA